MEINQTKQNYSPANFKMRIGPKFKEKLETEVFKNAPERLKQFEKYIDINHGKTEKTTVLDLFEKSSGNYSFVMSSELFPGVKYATGWEVAKNKLSNFKNQLISVCECTTEKMEFKLFEKGIAREISEQTPVSQIKKTGEEFKVNSSEKREKFNAVIDYAAKINDRNPHISENELYSFLPELESVK